MCHSTCGGLARKAKRPQSLHAFTSWTASSSSCGHASSRFFHAYSGPKSQTRKQTSVNRDDKTSPQNAPASPLTVTLEERRGRGERQCQPAPQPRPRSPGPPLAPAGPGRVPARAHLGRRGGPCPARPGAPDPRRGGAGPARRRLRGAGRQAGARHGSCPIQHFTIPSPVSFGRESPAQISEPALPRSAGTDISRPGLLTPSRARRPGRWGGQRRVPGRPGAQEWQPRSAPGGDIPLSAHFAPSLLRSALRSSPSPQN